MLAVFSMLRCFLHPRIGGCMLANVVHSPRLCPIQRLSTSFFERRSWQASNSCFPSLITSFGLCCGFYLKLDPPIFR